MRKLFETDAAVIEDNNEDNTIINIETKIDNSSIPNISEEYKDNMQVSIESFNRASNDLFIMDEIKTSIENKKLSSVEYFTSIENYNLCMKSIANNLGVSCKLPSMEDFKNPYGAEASHKFIMEGFKEFIRTIWERIKSFFRDFFRKVSLFAKRLVNANLELEEYEQYIDGLIHKVKASDKTKSNSILVDSLLPSMLTQSGNKEMPVSFLMTKGIHKLSLLENLIETVNKKIIPGFISSIESTTNTIANNYTEGYNATPEEAVKFIIEQRHNYLEALKNIFPFTTSLRDLPEDVYNEIISAFTGHQINDTSTFLSMVNGHDSLNMLPNSFNEFLVISNYSVSINNKESSTYKIFITPGIEKNITADKSMYTISDKKDLLKLYDFYKDFSKGVSVRHVEDSIDKLHNLINDIINKLEGSFRYALESSQDEPELSNSSFKYDSSLNFPDSNFNEDSLYTDKLKELSKDEIKEFQRFILSYLETIKVFIKDFAINVVGSYQECRYELIKYIYKSSKQFI